MDKDIFTLVGREEEKLKLWEDLAQAKGELLCKGQEDAVCKLRVTFFNTKTQCLECSFESSTTLKNQEEYLGHFFLGGEKYYFQTSAQIHQGKVAVPIPAELYHLQRRQNYRVRIPEGYKAFYNLILVNDQPAKITGQLLDLSSQGCRFLSTMTSSSLKMGDAVTGQLIIPKRSPMEIQGVVRHIKVDDLNKDIQTFGIEFTPLTPIVENKLFAITMEIHKEVFKRP